MAEEDVVVVGMGMMTPVGLSAAETAASVRAGVMRFVRSDWVDRHGDPMSLAVVPNDGLPELMPELADDVTVGRREARLLRLAALPIQEALKALGPVGQMSCLAIALPEAELDEPLAPEKVLHHLAVQTGSAFSPAESVALLGGRVGGLLAIAAAQERIRGGARFALAVGVDSYRRLQLLFALDRVGRLKSAHNLDGFIPGEGAGALLLTTRATARSSKLTPLATLSRVSEGFEEGHLASSAPYRGDGLAATITRLLQEADPQALVHEVYASMNGENHWAREWGVTFLRNKARFAPDARIWHPADCFGDLGAACGPVLTALAALNLRKGQEGGLHVRGPGLIYCSSDRGPRAALTITSA
jgi:3-oxoacyl-[acyl-carrier-protein] synthase-1